MVTEAKSVRLVAFCVLPQAYQLLSGWCAERGHKLLLVVTTPGPRSRPTPGYRGIVEAASRTQDVLITTHMQRLPPLLRTLQPDLILSFTFPYRLPADVLAVATFGAVNLHPTPLPHYRGPNPFRAMYEDHPMLGSTLHWTDAEFDTGNVLAQTLAPLPDDRSAPSLLGAWFSTMRPTLDAGIPRAIAGEPGTPQDESQASYGGIFSAEERWLDWNLPAKLLQARSVVLDLNKEGMDDRAAPGCLARIAGTPYAVQRVTPLAGVAAPAAPGTVLAVDGDCATLCCADGVLLVQARPL